MKIAFIKVNMMYSKGRDALRPLLFPIIRHLTPDNIEISFFDERIENLPDVLDEDIIALSVETFAAKHAYELAEKYKRTDNLIVMGGFHVSALPEEAGKYADVVLVGDAEDTWPKLLRDAQNGTVRNSYRSDGKCPILQVSDSERVYKGKKYLKLGMIQASRGCKFHCDFCSVKSLYPDGVRRKSAADVAGEMKNTPEKLIFFIDDNLFFNEKSARELCCAIRPLKKKWACQTSIEIALQDNLLDLMREAGCFMLLIGFESLSEENLRKMKKTANLAFADYDRAIENIYRHGIMIYGMFVIGYDDDTKETAEQILKYAEEKNFCIANFNPLMLLPGTDLYKRMESEDRLVYRKWWLDDNYRYGNAMHFPAKMTTEDLTQGCRRVRADFYSWKSILKRLVRERINHRSLFHIFILLAINMISRAEIRRKDGERLGEG